VIKLVLTTVGHSMSNQHTGSNIFSLTFSNFSYIWCMFCYTS
jgi:hypothetical protein